MSVVVFGKGEQLRRRVWEGAEELIDVDAFREMAGRMLDEVPEMFLRELNGGIVVVDEAQPHGPDLPDVYVLGEYIEDPYGLGRMIVLYYGSFAALYGKEPEERLRAELWETILHELRHHVEHLAGVDDLDREDQEDLAAFRAWEAKRRGDVPSAGWEL